MVGVGIELALVLGQGLDRGSTTGGVGIRFRSGEAIDVGVVGVERSEHVVEGAVLHHQHDDVFQLLDSRVGSIRRHYVVPEIERETMPILTRCR